MEQPKIDYTNIERFFMSIGVFFLFIAITMLLSILWISRDKNPNIFLNAANVLMWAFGIGGITLIALYVPRLRRKIERDEKYKFEINLKNIIDQDLKILELKTKELEYNRKVIEFNNDFKTKIETIKGRDVEGIVRQALDLDFYEKTYPKCFPKRKRWITKDKYS